ncbi:MAG: YbhN family protein [Anaerolineae bacterium]
MKDKLITLLKIIISLGLMAFLFYRFLSNPEDREVLLTSLTAANYGYLLLAQVLYLAAVLTNAVKWQILLRAQGIRVPFSAIVNYTFVGFFFNNFLPANVGGDVARGFGLARYTERAAEAAVSVVVDRIIGLLAFMFTAVVALLAAIFILNDQQLGQLDSIQVWAYGGLLLIALAFAVLLSRRLRQLLGRIFQIKVFAPFSPLYQRLSAALDAYRHAYSALLIAFTIGVVTVLLTGLVDIAIVAGLNRSIAPIYIFLMNPIIAFALIAPISIGGLGTMSAFYVYFYGLVNVAQVLAFALSLLKQVVIYVGSLPGGVLWLQRRGQASKPKSEEVKVVP